MSLSSKHTSSGSGSGDSFSKTETVYDWTSTGAGYIRDINFGESGGMIWPQIWKGDANPKFICDRNATTSSTDALSAHRLATFDIGNNSIPNRQRVENSSVQGQQIKRRNKKFRKDGVYFPHRLLKDGVLAASEQHNKVSNAIAALWLPQSGAGDISSIMAESSGLLLGFASGNYGNYLSFLEVEMDKFGQVANHSGYRKHSLPGRIMNINLQKYHVDEHKTFFAARTDKAVYCGDTVDSKVFSGTQIKPLRTFAELHFDHTETSSIAMSPFWPEISIACNSGEICTFNIEGLQSSTSKLHEDSSFYVTPSNVICEYCAHPKALLVATGASILKTDSRCPSSDILHVNESPLKTAYTHLHPFGHESAYFVASSSSQIQLFDERYFRPVISWKVQGQSVISSAAFKSNFNKDNKGFGIAISTDGFEKETVCMPFEISEDSGELNLKDREDVAKSLVRVPEFKALGFGKFVSSANEHVSTASSSLKMLEGQSVSEASSSDRLLGLQIIPIPDRKPFLICMLGEQNGISLHLWKKSANDSNKSICSTIQVEKRGIKFQNRDFNENQKVYKMEGLANFVRNLEGFHIDRYHIKNLVTAELERTGQPVSTYDVLLDPQQTASKTSSQKLYTKDISLPNQSNRSNNDSTENLRLLARKFYNYDPDSSDINAQTIKTKFSDRPRGKLLQDLWEHWDKM